MFSFLKKLAQPFLDAAIASGKPSAEAEVAAIGVKLEASIKTAVSKHVTDPSLVELIMAEIDTELASEEAAIDAKIEAFHVKL